MGAHRTVGEQSNVMICHPDEKRVRSNILFKSLTTLKWLVHLPY